MPSFSHTLQVQASPHDVFTIVEDTRRTHEWLDRCTGIDNLGEGSSAVGTPLRYHYKDGGRTGQMDGSITANEPDRHFTLSFTDKMMDVTVDFAMAPGAGEAATSLTHTVDIRTKGFGKVFTPMIKRSLPKQTIGAMENLKRLAEQG